MDRRGAPLPDGARLIGRRGALLSRSPGRIATNVAGAAFQSLSYAQQPPGVFVPGATLHFQFLYRDPFAGGSTTNASDAMTIGFGP